MIVLVTIIVQIRVLKQILYYKLKSLIEAKVTNLNIV